jgi:hypothetical protein
MALPVVSVRADLKHRDLLQHAAEMLRRGDEAVLRTLLTQAQARPVGPFRDEASAIGFLRDRLVVTLRPQAVWLFGSRARGDAGPDSDFDLLVVLPDGRPANEYTHEHVSAPVTASGVGHDIVPCSWTDFVKERDVAGTLVNRVVTEGRRIYGQPSPRARRRGAG